MKNVKILLLTIFALFIIIACDKDDSSNNPNGNNIMIIDHSGIDWSNGLLGSSNNPDFDQDGDIIVWCPSQGGQWMEAIWYRNFLQGDNQKLYKAGANIDFASVTTADETRFQNNPGCGVGLLVNGDVYVAKVKDGYVKFKVLDAPTDSTAIANSNNWPVKVEYKFSATANF